MNIKLKNRELPHVIDFLNRLNLAGKVSRARRKLIRKLQEKLIEVQADFKDSFAEAQDDEEIKEEEKAFLSETATVNLSEYQDQIVLLTQTLDNYPHELSGPDAELHDLLLDQLEEAMNHV